MNRRTCIAATLPCAWLAAVAAVALGCSSAPPASDPIVVVKGALTESSSYQNQLDTVVNPYCQAAGTQGEFTGAAGVPIRYVTMPAKDPAKEKGAIVVLQGRTETYLKYCELFYDFKDSGYSFYAFDFRGQGLSGRMLDDPQKGYVASFDDYVSDTQTFIDTVVAGVPHAKRYLLAHSMGGAVAARYLEQHQDVFDAAVLSSPMLQIHTAPYPEWLAWSISEGASAIGQGSQYVLGHGPYDPTETFAANTTTHSEARWTATHRLWLARPEIQLGGPTNQWMHESIWADWAARSWDAASLITPTLVLQAGADQIVVPAAEDVLCTHAASCQKVFFPTAGHEILNESDGIRDQALKAISAFFGSH